MDVVYHNPVLKDLDGESISYSCPLDTFTLAETGDQRPCVPQWQKKPGKELTQLLL